MQIRKVETHWADKWPLELACHATEQGGSVFFTLFQFFGITVNQGQRCCVRLCVFTVVCKFGGSCI